MSRVITPRFESIPTPAPGQSPFFEWAEPHRIDKAPVDAFTPLLLLGGMVGRATGATALDAMWGALIVEVGINAVINRAEPLIGPRAVPETEINILVDVVAGFVGWLIMDTVIRRST